VPLDESSTRGGDEWRGEFTVVDVTEILMHWHAGRCRRRSPTAWAWTARPPTARCGVLVQNVILALLTSRIGDKRVLSPIPG
jgi:hypothetical protein